MVGLLVSSVLYAAPVRSLLDAYVASLPLSSMARAELAGLVPDEPRPRLRDVQTTSPQRVSEDVRAFVQDQRLAFALTAADLDEYERLGYVGRIRFGSREEVRARQVLSENSQRALRTLGDPSARELARDHTVQSLCLQPGFTDGIVRELRAYARTSGHPVPHEGGYGEEYEDLSTRAKRALRFLRSPTLPRLQQTYSIAALTDRYGEKVARELAAFAENAGFPLREEQVFVVMAPPSVPETPVLISHDPFAALSPSTRKFLGGLGNPLPSELHERETVSSLVARGAEPWEVREIYRALKAQGYRLDPVPT